MLHCCKLHAPGQTDTVMIVWQINNEDEDLIMLSEDNWGTLSDFLRMRPLY